SAGPRLRSRIQYLRMNRVSVALLAAIAAPLFCNAASPLVGRWDFTVPNASGTSNSSYWLGVTGKNGALDVWFQPSGGNVVQVKDFKAERSHLSMTTTAATATRPATTWELDAVGGKLTGSIKTG